METTRKMSSCGNTTLRVDISDENLFIAAEAKVGGGLYFLISTGEISHEENNKFDINIGICRKSHIKDDHFKDIEYEKKTMLTFLNSDSTNTVSYFVAWALETYYGMYFDKIETAINCFVATLVKYRRIFESTGNGGN